MNSHGKTLKWAAVVASAFSISTASCPAAAQGPVGSIAAGAAATAVVDDMRSSLLQILSKLDNSVNSGTFQVRLQVSNLLSELDYHATGLENKTFKDLTIQQQTFFNNTHNTIYDLQSMGDHITDNADKVTERVEFAIGSAPFTSKEPRVRSQSPHAIAQSVAAAPVRVSIDGSWLANGKPELLIGGSTCKLVSLTEPSAAFECPATAFNRAPNQTNLYAEGQFSAVKDQTLIEQALNVIGMKSKPKIYPVTIGLLPDNFAHVSVSANYEVDRDQPNTRTANYDTGAMHCVWGSETTVNESPAGPEWKIDVNSIHLVLESGEHSELRNVTANGFQVYAVGHNHGNCTKGIGQVVSKDARGWAKGHVSWTEHKTVATTQSSTPFDQDIKWGDTRVISLPARTQSYKITTRLFNGSLREYNSPTHDEFVSIDADATLASLKLSPLPIDSAFK